jgi:aspartate kinase
MSEYIVAKTGGTSNRDAQAVERSLEWAEQADIFVASAPGEVNQPGLSAPKVTDMLLEAHRMYQTRQFVPAALSEAITARYADIVEGVGQTSLPSNWLGLISSRINQAVQLPEADTASMLGERLQAEIYESLGFTLLDPMDSLHDLGNNPDAWHGWLDQAFVPGKKYILPGNTTKLDGELVTFSRGGSDISGGLAAYGIGASKYLNLTDDSAFSANPRLFKANERSRLRRINHLLYEEARELGRNGTGLVHAAAMVPLMIGDIPTEVRSTFNRDASATLLDNDIERARQRSGQVVALSYGRGYYSPCSRARDGRGSWSTGGL